METKPKSLVTSLCGYVSAVFQDCRYLYARPSDWERDHSRLIHELGIKGERLLTLDFPAVAKHFDKCLDQGQYIPCYLPLTGLVSKVVKVPAFLRGLYLLVFDNDGKLRPTPEPNAILAIRTILMGVKKLNLPFTDRSLCHELEEFQAVERTQRSPSLNWLGDSLFDNDSGLFPEQVSDWPLLDGERVRSNRPDPRYGILRSLHIADARRIPSADQCEIALVHRPSIPLDDVELTLSNTIQLVADIVFSSFGDLHLEDPSELPKHGPGVVADLRKGESKFDFPYWTPKIDAIFPYDWYGTHTLGCRTFSRSDSRWISREVPSRIVAVPKTAKGPRLIAAEPVAHQWLQQLVMNQLVARLERTPIASCVRFNDQSRNQEFARKGSLDGDFATIDLSSASDRVSCWLVERFARSNLTLLERLHACRTRTAEWGGSKAYPKFRVMLKKFAPMGSACTFPVQSIIYCCVAIGVILHSEGKRPSFRSIDSASARCSVFGDDIIVPKENCAAVVKALEYLGLKINLAKTFGTGKFRESCGFDGYGGVDVTPPYLLDLPDSVRISSLGAFVTVANNYWHKGFWKTSDWLLRQLDTKLLRMVPTTTNREQTNLIYSYSGVNEQRLRKRYNEKLQRVEVYGIKTKSPKTKGPSSPASRLFQWFIERPQPDTKWVSGVAGRKDSTSSPGWYPLDVVLARVNCSNARSRRDA